MKNHRAERGFVLVTSLIVIILMTGLIIGFVEQVRTEQLIAGNDLDYTNAFYAAEAGLEKQNADLSKVFQQTVFPSAAQLSAIEASASYPALPNVTYVEYDVTGGQSTNLSAAVNAAVTTIPVVSTADWPATGYFMVDSEEMAYTGLTATSFTGVARAQNGTNAATHGSGRVVSRSRVVTIAQGPNAGLSAQVVPFDLTVTAQAGGGAEARLYRQTQVALIPVFQFGVFSDSDLAFHAGPSFNFGGRVHTNGNLFLMQGGGAGNVLTMSQKVTAVGEVVRQVKNNGVANTTHLQRVEVVTTPGVFRDLQLTEGSVTAGPSSAANANWPTLSLTTYNSYILNGATGAKPLTLPFAGGGAAPIEIIRRAPASEAPTSILGQSRLYNQASVRILLSDAVANLPGSAGYPLNATLYGPPYNYTVDPTHSPFAMTDPSDPDFLTPLNADETSSNPAIDGFIRVDMQLTNGSWQDVTMEILGLGVSTANPNAVLKFQRLAAGATAGSTTATDYWELKLWDPREGEFRQYIAAGPTKPTNLTKLGIMGIVELDITNLRRWLEGAIGVNGGNALNNNGYIVYFSDRRGNRGTSGNETGEFGFEDIVNPSSVAGIPNGILDAGEDFNGNGTLDTYGANLPVNPYTASTDIWSTRWTPDQARKNKIYYFRRALRLINGGGDTLPDPGFTVASENAVYVQGDYNAATSAFAGTHSSAAVIADTVKFLSNAWNDDNSFDWPHDVNSGTGRAASSTVYRLALAAGKTINFTHPSNVISDDDYGGDGGVHNFFHYMERWNGQMLSYLGSLVSLYYSNQMTGEMKCCAITYSPPTRDFRFDVEFLVPSQLPPGTPMFRDINNLSFQQTILAD